MRFFSINFIFSTYICNECYLVIRSQRDTIMLINAYRTDNIRQACMDWNITLHSNRWLHCPQAGNKF